MSDPNAPDATPTESLELADQQPVGAATAPAASAPAATAPGSGGHTRTILEVVGVVIAGVLIVGAGAVGFALGHATDDGRWSMNHDDRGQYGPDAGGPVGPGGQLMPPGQGQPGPRGVDPDGDDWGGHRDRGQRDAMGGGMGDGQTMPGLGGQDPRGVDPDGDNWTGQMMPGQGEAPTAPTVPPAPTAPSSQG